MNETTEQGPARALPAQFGPKPGHLRRAELENQVHSLASRLVLRVQALGMPLDQPGTITATGKTLLLGLGSHFQSVREESARQIGLLLLDVGERDSADFWATDLGRAVAREIGYVGPWAPHAVAQAVLQVSRQAIDQMAARGRLEMEGRSISRRSLQAAAAERWPREADQ